MVKLMAIALVLAAATPAVAEPSCAEITATLRADAEKARSWDTAWLLIYAGAAVGTAVVAGATEGELSDDTRWGMRVSAVKATIGAAAKVVRPLRIPVPKTCADAPAALALAAKRERNNFWLNTIGGLAVNAGGALYLGLEKDTWRTAASSFAVGAAVSVLSSLTMPKRAWRKRLVVVPTLNGVALAGEF
jgi:hypothetical protein